MSPSRTTRASLRRSIIGVAVLLAGAALFGLGVTGGVLANVGLGAVLAIVGVFVLGPVIARPLAAHHRLAAHQDGHDGSLRTAERHAEPPPDLVHRRRPHDRRGAGGVHLDPRRLDQGVDLRHPRGVDARRLRGQRRWRRRGRREHGDRAAAGVAEHRSTPSRRSAWPGPPWSRRRCAGRRRPIRPPTTASDVAGIDPTTIDRVFDGKLVAGQLHDVDATGVAVKQDEAEAKHLAVGDQVTATFKNGVAVPLHVTAIFSTALTGSGGSSYLVSLDTFQANAETELDSIVLLKVRDGVTPAAARAEVEQVLAELPQRRAAGPGRGQGRHREGDRSDAQPDLRPARPGHRHRPHRHRQHPGPVGARADPGAGPAPGRSA